MVQKTNILYIGRHPEIMETVVRLINKNTNWNGIGTLEDTRAMKLFTGQEFDIVLLGCGINEAEELQLRDFFTRHNPAVKIVQHYGGGSGLLAGEIYTALGGGAAPNFLS